MEEHKDKRIEKKSLKDIIFEMRVGSIWGLLVTVSLLIGGAFTLGVKMAPSIQKSTENQIRPTLEKQAQFRTNDEVSSSVLAAGALVVEYENGEYLMLGVLHVDETGLAFSPPAGKTKTDINESPNETAKRETFEETGYTIKELNYIEKAPKGNKNFSLISARIDYSIPQQNFVHEETAGIIWCNPSDIPPSNWRFPEQRDWIIEKFEEIVRKRKN